MNVIVKPFFLIKMKKAVTKRINDIRKCISILDLIVLLVEVFKYSNNNISIDDIIRLAASGKADRIKFERNMIIIKVGNCELYLNRFLDSYMTMPFNPFRHAVSFLEDVINRILKYNEEYLDTYYTYSYKYYLFRLYVNQRLNSSFIEFDIYFSSPTSGEWMFSLHVKEVWR